MNIAITGANGFVGSNLCHSLLKAGHNVFPLIRQQADTRLLPNGVEPREIDYGDLSSIHRAISDCDTLVHNAGKTRTLTHQEMLTANVGNTNLVIEAANNTRKLQRLLFISSQAASRPSVDGNPIDEDAAPAPVTWYGKSKLLAEKLIQTRCQKDWTILRPVPVYGGGDKDFLALFRSLRTGVGVRLGKRDQIINMLHVSELISFIELSIDHPAACNQIFFVSDGMEYTQSGIQRAIANTMCMNIMEIVIPSFIAKTAFAVGDVVSRGLGKATVLNTQKMLEIMAPNWNCSIAKARRILGWDPVPCLEEHLQETYQWYKDHSWL